MDSPNFEDIVEQHYADLYRFALSLTQNEADSCDLVKEIFLIYANRSYQIRDFDKIKSWLFTTLYREFLRQPSRDQPCVRHDEHDLQLPEAPFGKPSESAAQNTTLLQALATLDVQHRAVLTLFYGGRLSSQEIASILDIPVSMVMSCLLQAKDAFGRKVENSPSSEKVGPGHPLPTHDLT